MFALEKEEGLSKIGLMAALSSLILMCLLRSLSVQDRE